MTRTRYLTPALMTLAALTLCAAGCSKTKEPAEPAMATELAMATERAIATEPVMVAEPAMPRRKSELALLPMAADFAGGVDVTEIVQSKLFQITKPLVMASLGSLPDKFQKACHTNLLTAVRWIQIAGRQANSDETVALINGLSRPELDACATALSHADGKQLKITHEGQIARIEEPSGVLYAGWADAHTVVLGPMVSKDKARMEAQLTSAPGLDQSQPMMALVRNIDTRAAAWVVYQNQGGDLLGFPCKAIYATLRLDDGLALDAGFLMESPENAASLAEVYSRQLQSINPAEQGPLGPIAARIQLSAKGAYLKLQLLLTEAEMTNLVQALVADPAFVQQLGAWGVTGAAK